MEEKDIYNELNSIRNLMERSSKFISLSGLSGVLVGCYALIGALIAYQTIHASHPRLSPGNFYVNDPSDWWTLLGIAMIVLITSLITVTGLTIRQSMKKGENSWNPVSRRLLMNLTIPLLTGGLFLLILIIKGDYEIIIPGSLIFYGLALVAGSQYTFTDVKWLGICEIILGLLAALFPELGLILWAAGFGILHILYGTVMHFKYKQ